MRPARTAVVVAAVVVAVASFLPWYGATAGPVNESSTAYQAGATAWGGVVLLVFAAGYAISRAAPRRDQTVLAASVAGLALVVLRLATLPRNHFLVSAGPRYGIWVALAAAVVETGCAVLTQRRA